MPRLLGPTPGNTAACPQPLTSPRHHVSTSPRIRVSAIPGFRVSASPHLRDSSTPQLRDFAQAKADLHPIAADISAAGALPEHEAAAWFANLKAGHLHCCFPTPPDQPPCTADATVAVSQKPNDRDGQIDFSCRQNLAYCIAKGLSYYCHVGHKNLRCDTTPSHCRPPNGTSVTLLTPRQISTPRSDTAKAKSNAD